MDEKIKERMTAYYRNGNKAAAVELATLCLQLAEQKDIEEEKRKSLIYEFFWWIRAASLSMPRYLKRVHCWLERERIKRLLIAVRTY